MLILPFITYAILLSIAYMDFTSRSVQLFLLIGLFVLNMLYVSVYNGIGTALQQFFINSTFTAMVTVVLFVYYRMKERPGTGFINTKLGAGDVVFWLCITPLFSLMNFILFFIVSLVLVLVIVFVQLSISKKAGLVPLAGWQALILLLLMAANTFITKFNFSIDVIQPQNIYTP